MKRLYLITSFIVLLLIVFLGVTYSYEYNDSSFLEFELIGDYEVFLNIGEPYIEYGVKVYDKGKDVSYLINIDNSKLDVNKIGIYKIKYEVNVDGKNEYIYRLVNVVDNVKPVIKLLGEDVVYVKLGEDYIEPGYIVSDNSLEDLKSNVLISSNMDVFSVGEYEIKYLVADNSGNEESVIRKVVIYR